MNKVLDNSKRAKNLTIGFYILSGVYLLSLISDFLEYRLLSKGFFAIFAGADANDQRQAIVAIILFGASLAVIIMFIQWFRRAYHNLHKAGAKNLKASEGWAAGAWFVPIMNLFRPYQIMQDIWRETKKYVQQNSGVQEEDGMEASSDSNQVVGLWWAFWIISSISANVSNNIARKADSIPELQNANMFSMISTVTGFVAIYFILKIIKESQQDQEKFLVAWQNRDNGGDTSSFNISESDEILD